MTIHTKCYTVVKAYVHVFMAYLKAINQEFQRPIVSFVNFVNSLTMAISGYLAKILLPVVGNTDYTV